MGDAPADPKREPPECKALERKLSCPNIKEVGGGMQGEQYDCQVCGRRIYLDYDEMR